MIREIREEDKQLYMDLTEEFYNSEAVLHPIPEAYREATFHEMMRSQDYVKAYILEKDGQAAGYGLTSYTFSQEAGGKEMCIRDSCRTVLETIGVGVGASRVQDWMDLRVIRDLYSWQQRTVRRF